MLILLISVLSVLSVVSCTTCPAASPLERPAVLKHPALEKRIKKSSLRENIKAVGKEKAKRKNLDPALGKTATADNAAAWESLPVDALAYVPWPLPEIRGIAEVRTPQTDADAANQVAELAYFSGIGYNTVLAVWRGESPVALSAIVRGLRNDGWNIILVFGPAENGDATPYLDPDQFRQAFALLLPDCDALLITWRLTSPRHWQGKESTLYVWSDRVSTMARRARHDVPIIGELFFAAGERRITGWCPANVSAALVTGAGCNGLVPAGIARLAREKTEKPLLALIIGPNPYYNTLCRYAELPADYIRQTCNRLETRYCREGFAGTITLAGDGIGDIWYLGNYYSDSLTKTNWSKTQKETAP